MALIPTAHQVVAESSFEKRLPQDLVTFELLDTPVWRWIALILMGAVAWYSPEARVRGDRILRALPAAPLYHGPLRMALAAGGFRIAMELAPPASLSRLFIERGIALIFFLSLAWAGGVVVDYIAGGGMRSSIRAFRP